MVMHLPCDVGSSPEPAPSLELRFLIDRALHAHAHRQPDQADAFAKCAERLIRTTLPAIADDISQISSRKGDGHAIAARLLAHLTARTAAEVASVLLLRRCRRPVLDAISKAFGGDPVFAQTVAVLCGRAVQGQGTQVQA